MKDSIMAKSDWRTIQFFLSVRGVFEVQIDLESDGARCNCPEFKSREGCKHSRYVVKKIRGNNGVYPMKVSSRASQEEIKRANESTADEFREFVVNFSKIEVL